MNRKILKASAVSAFALTLVMWGCESLGENALLGPSDKSDVLIVNTDESGYTTAVETDPSVGVVTAVIDQNGGSLNIGNHVLTVPAGAVDGPTTFTMTKLVNEIEVGLTATRLLPNDIGREGFAVPVHLSLSFANAADVPANIAEYKVAWKKADGTLEIQPTVVDASGSAAIGALNHFSQYNLVTPKDPSESIDPLLP